MKKTKKKLRLEDLASIFYEEEQPSPVEEKKAPQGPSVEEVKEPQTPPAVEERPAFPRVKCEGWAVVPKGRKTLRKFTDGGVKYEEFIPLYEVKYAGRCEQILRSPYWGTSVMWERLHVTEKVIAVFPTREEAEKYIAEVQPRIEVVKPPKPATSYDNWHESGCGWNDGFMHPY